MRLDPDILDGPPEFGVRIVTLARLADAEEALASLARAPGPSALPTFRSALRRLAGALRAGAPALAGAISEERVLRLEAAARRTADARDAEMLARWLEENRADLPGPYRGALDWLADRVERRRAAATEDGAAQAGRRFRRIAARLRVELTARRPAPSRSDVPATFAMLVAGAVRARTRALRDAVIGVAGPSDAPGLRRVRGEAKRLRDLLQPLSPEISGAREALAVLGQLHGLVAEWHGAANAEMGIEAALLEARAEEARRGEAAIAGLRPGLLALLHLAQQRAAESFARLSAEHLETRAITVTDAAYALAASLEVGAGVEEESPSAPERRFLVTGVPPEGRGGDLEELEQGWLPGDGRESVGVARSACAERWFRTRGCGRGRSPRVEPISRPDFDALWPLTVGRRIARKRHAVPEAPGWCFHEYIDRPLVLAVAEEGNADAPPPWLEAVVVREVSGERGYLDEALARRPTRRAG